MSEPVDPDVQAAIDAHAKAVHDDYSQYVAKYPITYDGTVAHWPGQPVPASNVERNGWQELVEPAPKPAEQTAETPAAEQQPPAQ